MRIGRFAGLFLWAAVAGLGAEAEALANEREMKIVLVRAAGDCGAACPEWISAEGEITSATPAAFAAIVKTLGKRRPPLVIHSAGGSIDASIAFGRIVRRNGFDVAVGRTDFSGCQPGHSGCPKPEPGRAYVGTVSHNRYSICSSACVSVLAAGKKRVLLGNAHVGVHQHKFIRPEQTVRQYRIYYRMQNGRRVEVRREAIGSKHLKRKEYVPKANDRSYRQVATHFSSMGVDPKLVELFQRAPPERMYWLSNIDIDSTKIATFRLTSNAFLKSPADTPGVTIGKPVPLSQPPVPIPAGVLVTPPLPPLTPPHIPGNLGKSELLVGHYGSRDIRLEVTFTLEDENRLIRLSVRPLIERRDFVGAPVLLFEIEGGKAFLAFRPDGSSFLPLQSTIPLADFCLIQRNRPIAITFSHTGDRVLYPFEIKRDAHPIYIQGVTAGKACAALP